MPTYDYRCSECGHAFEELESMSALPLTECPRCRKQSLKRLIAGGAGMVFKGSGFYLTDYVKPGASKSDTASAPKAPPKTDNKPTSSSGGSAPTS